MKEIKCKQCGSTDIEMDEAVFKEHHRNEAGAGNAEHTEGKAKGRAFPGRFPVWDSGKIIMVFLSAAGMAALFLAVTNIVRHAEARTVLFYALAGLCCLRGVHQVRIYADESAVYLWTLIRAAVLYFVCIGFGSGPDAVWRVMIGIVLYVLAGKGFREIIRKCNRKA